MNQTETGKIYSAINAIMAEIPAIGKNQKNDKQGFMYRGIDVVMNVLQPLLSKHKVFVAPEVLSHEREERTAANGGRLLYSICTIKYTFYAEDGSSVAATVVGEGMDSGDKATNKAMAIAFKYACFQVFCIPTEEMKDTDAETPPPSEPKKAEPKPEPKKDPSPKATPLYLCETCGEVFKPFEFGGIKYTAEDAYNAAFERRKAHICQTCYKKSAAKES